jgi:hypothetical protein
VVSTYVIPHQKIKNINPLNNWLCRIPKRPKLLPH